MELIKTFRKAGCTLRLWDTFKVNSIGKTVLRYELKHGRRVIFAGSDFSCSPLHADDSLETVEALLGFLTLQPGDTDREYFDGYTQEQLDFAGSSAADELRQWAYAHEENRRLWRPY